VPVRGGEATFTVTTQQHTNWQPLWDSYGWLLPGSGGAMGVGSGPLTFQVTQTNQFPGTRSIDIVLADATATVTQEAGLGLTSVTPGGGPAEGGTLVTLTGTGFEPDMTAHFGGGTSVPVAEFIDATTVRVMTPPSPSWNGEPIRVPVAIATSDGRFAWLDQGFEYGAVADVTPPMVMGWPAGPQGQNGWFVGDVTITWGIFDGESPMTSPPCPVVVVTQDTAGTTYTCEATSAGGTAVGSVTVRRDTTAPTIGITSPRAGQLVEPNGVLPSTFTCSDAGSGVSICGMAAPSGPPLDTATPGWHTFVTAATDQAGNVGMASVDYAVSTGVCVAPVQGLKHWLPFEGNMNDRMFWVYAQTAQLGMVPRYGPGVSGQGFRFESRSSGRLEVWPFIYMPPASGLSLALWIEPGTNSTSTLLDRPNQFRLRREAGGTISWTLVGTDNVVQTGTSIGTAPQGAWTHVALTYDAGDVRLYLNGRLDRAWSLTLPVLRAPTYNDIGFGNGISLNAPYVGGVDELQIFTRGITAADVEGIFLSGAAGGCPPAPTTVTAPPITVTYGAGTYPAVATLRTASGVPLAGKSLWLTQLTGTNQPSTDVVTDATGTARWNAPFSVGVGTHQYAFRAFFRGDLDYLYSEWVYATLTVTAAPTQVTWSTPAPITYGTALSAAQLNATGSVAGTIAYTPPAGTVLGAGPRTLTATLTPSNTNYAGSSTSVTIDVRKALPVVTVTSPSVVYNGQPQPVTGSARDYRGVALSPVTITYDGASTAPTAAGVYTVVASFAGDANHEPASATGTLTIARATPTVTFSTPVSFTYDAQPHGVAATVTGIGGIVLGTAPVTYNGSPDRPVGSGSYVASATFDGNMNYLPRTVTTTVTILKATPSVVFAPQPLTATYDGQPHPVAATVLGVGGTTITVVPVTYNGSAGVPVDAGSYTVAASWAGDANYLARNASATLTIAKATPSIVFDSSPATFTYDGQGHALTATVVGVAGTSLGTASMSYSGAGIPPVAVGTYTASASFGGNANYTSTTATTPITITRATPLVTISGGPFVFNGVGKAATVTVTGVGGQTVPSPVTVTYDGGAALPVSAGAYAVVATVAASGNYAGGSGTGTLVIEPATPPIYWSAPAPITYGTPLDNRQLGAHSSVTGTWTYAPAAGTVLDVGLAQTLTVSFTPTDANYVTATATRTIDVQRATAFISIAPQFFNYDGQPHPSTMASAHGAGYGTLTPITLTYDGSPTPPVNAGTYTVVATFEGDERFLPASGSSTLTINKAQATISWSAPVSLTYGTPLGPEFFTATADIPGTFTYTPEAGTILDASYPAAHTIRANFTPADSVNYAVQSYPRPVWVYRAMPTVRAFGGGFVYDGQPHAGSGTATGVGGVALTPVTVTYNDSLAVPVAVGSYTVRATFEGNANYSSNSHATTLVISRATATVALTGGTFTYDGQPHAATASVTGVGGVALTPVSVTYNGSTAVPVSAGSYNVVATFAGDANHASASATATITIGQAVATLSWNAPAAIGYGTPLGAPQLNATASVPGTFAYSPAAGTILGAGAGRPLTATFTPADPANYSGGTVGTTITVVPGPLTVRTNDAVKAYGVSLPGFTAAFTGLVNGDTPASLGGALGFATAATSSSPVGTYAVTPAGLSSPNYAIAFASGTLSIVKAPVAMTLTASPTPSGLDMPITFTATVASAPGAPTAPAGTVRFFDGTTLLGTGTLAGNTATLLTGGLTAGAHTIEARYDGDASFEVGSRTATHVVTTAAATPAITLTTSRQPATTTQSMTFTATITVATSGSIAFYDGGTLLGSGSIASGRATLTVASLAAGSHAITARFQGNASAPPVISAVLVQSITAGGSWRDRTSTMSLTSSANPSTPGSVVTFTATASGSSGTPAGRILFMVDGFVVGDPTGVPVTTVSSSAARATVSVPTLAGGRHKVTATYLGSSNYRGSNGALTQTVN
jgi:hypothetical protein